MSRGVTPVWAGFVWAALALAITAGFGLGGDLFMAQALHRPLDAWWPAAAQAHGHVQLFGWAGLMVLGVGLHFLPRLRGAPSMHQGQARAALALLVSGLVLRVLTQPLLAAAARTLGLVAPLRLGLVCSGFLEFAGASVAVGVLARVARQGPPLRSRAGLWPVLPFFITAFVAFWLALAANAVGLIVAATGDGLVPGMATELSIQLAFYGFLIPVSIAMSERTCPLFLRTPLPRLRLLRGALALLLAGLAVRSAGEWADVSTLAGLGQLILAAAVALVVLALGIFAPRRPLPRQPVRPLADPIQWHVLSAYAWLLLAALLLVANGLSTLGISGLTLSVDVADAEHHVLGAGFITLLILGMGAQLLPGFANRRLRSRVLVWATLVLGNAAALLRVVPLVMPAGLSPALRNGLLASAGIVGLAALMAFGLNLSGRRGVAGQMQPGLSAPR